MTVVLSSLSAFRRRLHLGLALGGLADGLAALALTLVGVIVVARIFGLVLTPRPEWAAALVVPRWSGRACACVGAACRR
ncbi:MAG: hypothetical protein IPM13_19285 [Phycisphaerales bacterium]|nr:hypothetical protein [Phycisphaerales bacterium]